MANKILSTQLFNSGVPLVGYCSFCAQGTPQPGKGRHMESGSDHNQKPFTAQRPPRAGSSSLIMPVFGVGLIWCREKQMLSLPFLV